MSNGSTVHAGIIHFINPPPGQEGHFNWHWQDPFGDRTFENWLDVTRPSTDQFGVESGNSIGQLSQRDGERNFTSDGASIATTEGTVSTHAFMLGEEMIDYDYDEVALHVYDSGLSEFPQGDVRYIGVLTASGNYGWIAVERMEGGYPERMNLIALAWAYQTEPGVSIRAGEVPGVGGVALFGLAGLGARRRRRHA
jgi:MYXO-CTERM domain-containing protein